MALHDTRTGRWTVPTTQDLAIVLLLAVIVIVAIVALSAIVGINVPAPSLDLVPDPAAGIPH